MVSISRLIRVVALFAAAQLGLFAAPGHALGIGLTGDLQSSPTVVRADQVRARAVASFDGTVQRRLAEAREGGAEDPQSAGRYRQAAERIRATFARELDIELEELEGDGLLEVSEVSDAVGELRDELLSDLSQAFEAAAVGRPPPPLQRDYDGTWPYARDVVHYTFLVRNDWAAWGRLALYVAGGLLLTWLVGRGLVALTRWLRPRGWSTTVLLLSSLRGPLYLLAIVVSLYLGLERLWIPGIAQPALDKALGLIVLAAVFWILWGSARAAAAGGAKLFSKTYRRSVDHHVELFILRVLRVLVLLGFVVALVNVVFSSNLAGFLTGLGIVGVVLSFVLRGSIENLAAAFTLFGDKPIRVGDLLIFKDAWAKVEDIGFRATRIRTFDGHLIHVPNSEIIGEAIWNVSARPYIRRRFRLSLTYDTPPDKVREAIDILEDILHDHEGQPDDQPPHVLFEGYGAFDLRLLVQYCVQPPDYWEVLAFDSRINLQILERFAAAGIEFAFPTQTNVLKTDPEQPPELQWRRAGQGDGSAEGDDTPDRAPRRDGGRDAGRPSAKGEYREGDDEEGDGPS